MDIFARVDGGVIVERRRMDEAAIPSHKRDLWRKIVWEGEGPVEQEIIEENQIRVVRSDLPLADVKAQLSRQVDLDAEMVRLKYITPGDGQIMTYNEKHAQARAVLTLGDTAANALTEAERDEQFPTLSASVGLEADTLFGCAQLVVSRYEAFADLSRIIERTRLAGKKSISDASDHASARAAYAGITWTV